MSHIRRFFFIQGDINAAPLVNKNQTTSLCAICWSALKPPIVTMFYICLSWEYNHNAQELQHTLVVKAVATEEENTMQVNVKMAGLHCASITI